MKPKGWTEEASESQQRIHSRLTRPDSVPSNLPLENLGTENGAMAEVKYAAEVPGTNSCRNTAPVFSLLEHSMGQSRRCPARQTRFWVCRTRSMSFDGRSTCKARKWRIQQMVFTLTNAIHLQSHDASQRTRRGEAER